MVKFTFSEETMLSAPVKAWGAVIGFVVVGALFYSDTSHTKDRVTIIEAERKVGKENYIKVLSRIDRRLYRMELEQGIKDAEPLLDDGN